MSPFRLEYSRTGSFEVSRLYPVNDVKDKRPLLYKTARTVYYFYDGKCLLTKHDGSHRFLTVNMSLSVQSGVCVYPFGP